jgi:energy-coupling factor transport system substrate-specific component
MLKRFSARDLILITSIAALGIAVKPIINPLPDVSSHWESRRFAGWGINMLWLVLALCIVRKKWTGTIFGMLQAVLVLLIGMAGKMGAFSLVAYTIPGIVADLVFFSGLKPEKLFTHLLLCAMANLAGSVVTALFFFHHPLPVLALNSGLAIISGLSGGALSFGIYQALQKARILL